MGYMKLVMTDIRLLYTKRTYRTYCTERSEGSAYYLTFKTSKTVQYSRDEVLNFFSLVLQSWFCYLTSPLGFTSVKMGTIILTPWDS